MQKSRGERSAVEVLWLSVSQSLKCFDQRLLSQLATVATVRRWEYSQTVDEACCLDAVVDALHDYVCQRAHLEKSLGNQSPCRFHLVGHGVSGVVGLFYARRYPQHVASLTLLSVSVAPAVNWQAYYYVLRQRLPCSREMILGHMAKVLCGQRAESMVRAVATRLAQDLDGNLTLHSLASRTNILPGGVEVPLLVCNGQQDPIVKKDRANPQMQTDWQAWFKAGDQLWECPSGKHFFQFHHAVPTAKQMSQFWSRIVDVEKGLLATDPLRLCK